jgi:hypothetical protein
MTPGQHRLEAARRPRDWVNERGATRPALIRLPRWVPRLWAGIRVHRGGA